MQHTRDDSDDIERAWKRRRLAEAAHGVNPKCRTTTWNGNSASAFEDGNHFSCEQITSNLEYARQYSNSLFSRVESEIDRCQTPKTYLGETIVGDSAVLVQGDITHNHYHLQGPQQDRYDVLLESLTFDRMDARLRNVALPFTNTCQWLFKNDLFCRWTDKNQAQDHHGFFWIKGKPGSGKSTIMKEVVTWAQRTWEAQIVLTYFFNARSPQPLEKSTLGLYRSLLHQLLLAHPYGHLLFADRFASKIRASKRVEEWSVVELQNFLVELITTISMSNVNIFIDALDEGDTDDNRQMITFLEQLTRSSFLANKFTRVCLSSRHYPHISVRKGLSLILEEQPSHRIDIDTYIQNELTSHGSLQMDQLRQEVRDRSAGVFLWVVLVIPMLRRGLDRGKSVKAVRQELSRIPQDLRKMFVEILSRDTEGRDECVALLRWVLFSQRPLSLPEAYDAINQACSVTYAREEADLRDSTLIKYLLHCSRGLIETIEDGSDWRSWLVEGDPRQLVQFIHETVREFLLGEIGSGWTTETSDARPDEAPSFQADACHIAIAEECIRYVLQVSERTPVTEELAQYPLAGYAAQYWHMHLRACSTQPTPEILELISQVLNVEHDRKLLAILKTHGNVHNEPFYPAVYRPVHVGVPRLALGLLSQGVDIDAPNRTLDTAFIVAADSNSQLISQLLLDYGANINVQNQRGKTTLFRVANRDDREIVQTLLMHGANIDVQNKQGETALFRAAGRGDKEMVQMLLNHGADTQIQDENGETALNRAAEQDHESIVQLLLEHGARVADWALLLQAMSVGSTKTMHTLFEHGSRIGSLDKEGFTALSEAVCRENEQMVQLAVNCGAKVDLRDGSGRTVLSRAIARKNDKIVEILLKHGCKTDLLGPSGNSSISKAMHARSKTMARLLLKHGADPNALAGDDCSPLCYATMRGQTEMIELLLEYKASPDTKLCKNEKLETEIWQASVLEAAVTKLHFGDVQLLLESGVNVHDPVIYKEGFNRKWMVCTLLQLAERSEDRQILPDRSISSLLRDYGAPEVYPSERQDKILLEHGLPPNRYPSKRGERGEPRG